MIKKTTKKDLPPIPVLRQLMEEREIKRIDLAKYLGISAVAVGQYYNGEALPTIDKLIKIADFFNVSTDYLLGRTDIQTIDPLIKAMRKYTGLSSASTNTLKHLAASESYRSSVARKMINNFIKSIYLDFVKSDEPF